jgi:hypothetical protein
MDDDEAVAGGEYCKNAGVSGQRGKTIHAAGIHSISLHPDSFNARLALDCCIGCARSRPCTSEDEQCRCMDGSLALSILLHTSMKLNIALLACSAVSLCSSLVSGQELSSRLSKFHSLASKNSGIVPLTSSLYDELIQDSPSSPREYSVSIILTALNPKFGCQPCVAFDKEHKEAARQWWTKSENKKSKEKQMRHVFAVLDFEKGQDIFKRVGSSRSFHTPIPRPL